MHLGLWFLFEYLLAPLSSAVNLNWQVSIMQQELKELQPELIQTSKETEQLIKIIAGETVEVEEKKQVGFDIT